MTTEVSIRSHLQTKIALLEALQAWFTEHTSSTSTPIYGSGSVRSYADLMAEIVNNKMTIDNLFEVGDFSLKNRQIQAVIVRSIYRELTMITQQDRQNPLTQIFTHIHQHSPKADDNVTILIKELFETQIKNLNKAVQVLMGTFKKPEDENCLKRYFYDCFTHFKCFKYHTSRDTKAEKQSLLIKASKVQALRTMTPY